MSGCRHRCRCSRCRGEFRDLGLIGFDMAAVAVMLLIAGVMWLVMVPLRVWHVTGPDGQQHPDAATWIAYGSGGAVVTGALMFFSIRSARKREQALAARRPPAMPSAPPLPRRAVRGFPPPACRHLRAVPVNDLYERRVAWLCPDPPLGCGAQLDPGARSAELTPDASWPPVRKAGR